jgi:hypothetical protein
VIGSGILLDVTTKRAKVNMIENRKTDCCLLKPRMTNFGKRWMNENKHPCFLGHRGMKGDYKDEKGCPIPNYVEGRNLGKEGCGGMRNGECGNSKVLKTLIKIDHLLDV